MAVRCLGEWWWWVTGRWVYSGDGGGRWQAGGCVLFKMGGGGRDDG